MGGPLFMGILTLLLIAMVVWYIYTLVTFLNTPRSEREQAFRKMGYGRSIGLFAMITGILGQLIGLYDAFSAIEHAGDISPALVFGGIKVSMITTLYGIFIFLVSLLIWFFVSMIIERKAG